MKEALLVLCPFMIMFCGITVIVNLGPCHLHIRRWRKEIEKEGSLTIENIEEFEAIRTIAMIAVRHSIYSITITFIVYMVVRLLASFIQFST
jgi:hypothetical protein